MTFGLVLDASVAVAFILADEERSADAQRLMELVVEQSALVPAIWPFEIGHVLVKKVRQRAIADAEAERALLDLYQLPIAVVGESRGIIAEAVWSLALRHRIGLYDASYIDLALQTGLPLATFDHRMRGVAEVERISVLD